MVPRPHSFLPDGAGSAPVTTKSSGGDSRTAAFGRTSVPRFAYVMAMAWAYPRLTPFGTSMVRASADETICHSSREETREGAVAASSQYRSSVVMTLVLSVGP